MPYKYNDDEKLEISCYDRIFIILLKRRTITIIECVIFSQMSTCTLQKRAVLKYYI